MTSILGLAVVRVYGLGVLLMDLKGELALILVHGTAL